MAAVISIILSLLPLLQKAIGNKWVDLGVVITNAVDALWLAFKAGNLTNDVLVGLQQLQSVLQAIINDTSANPDKLALAEEVAGIFAAAITGLVEAEAGADPSLLPIPPPVE